MTTACKEKAVRCSAPSLESCEESIASACPVTRRDESSDNAASVHAIKTVSDRTKRPVDHRLLNSRHHRSGGHSHRHEQLVSGSHHQAGVPVSSKSVNSQIQVRVQE